MILLIDNYDSFVYNLACYIKRLGHDCLVKRNDKHTLADVQDINPTHIIISPGPCTPNEAGISLAVIQHFGKNIPILGVCLGHQAIGQAFGGTIIKALEPMHGMASPIFHDQKGLFAGLDNPLNVARYHSLVIDINHFPDELTITAKSMEGEIMALQHKHYPIYGVQFHPESILTQHGLLVLDNFIQQNVKANLNKK